jgi:Nif-specific regulatory protein
MSPTQPNSPFPPGLPFTRDPDQGATEILHATSTDEAPPLTQRTAAAQRLDVLYDVARAMNELEDTDVLLGRILEAILRVLGCERGVIALRERDGDGQSVQHRVVRARDPQNVGQIVISRSILEATLSRRQNVIAADKMRFDTMLEHKVLSAMAVPLAMGPNVLGLIYVDERVKNARFGRPDLDFLGALAQLTAAALENAERYQRAAALVEALSAESATSELLGESAPMRLLKKQIRKVAAAPNAHVLIHGESGTGKELVARTVHALSPRADKPFVTLNCAAIPETMIENELFGHVKGAFTGAVSDKRGKFTLADKGTLFLDEIGDLSLTAQAKVLRAVQEGEVQPIGSEKTQRVNVRILSATHKDLAIEVEAGRFREDLFYRLNVVELWVPPLRNRGEDIPPLAQRFLEASAAEIGKGVAGFTQKALAALASYRFPGNVRELKNEVERAAILVEGGDKGDPPAVVDVHDLSPRITGRRPPKAWLVYEALPDDPRTLAERYKVYQEAEAPLIKEALARAEGNITEAALSIGLSRFVFKTRMKHLEIDKDEA